MSVTPYVNNDNHNGEKKMTIIVPCFDCGQPAQIARAEHERREALRAGGRPAPVQLCGTCWGADSAEAEMAFDAEMDPQGDRGPENR